MRAFFHLFKLDLYYFEMDNKQQKQAFLRDKILGNNFDPNEFVMFLNSKIPIGDNIDLCTMDQL